VLDGFGVASATPGNAICRASASTFDSLVNRYPSLTLQAAGPNVGLPWGEPGNSEVGHMCLGAGRIVLQDLPRIDREITSGSFFKNEALISAIEHALTNHSALHLIGLLGSGGVHASQLHLYALLDLAVSKGLKEIYIHAITDGRDTPQDSGREAVKELEKKILQNGGGRIASVTGRFFAMDRAQHWDLTELAFRAMVLGQAQTASSALGAVDEYYRVSVFDETIPPTLIVPPGTQPIGIKSSDSVICFNFRADRMIQLTTALTDPSRCKFSTAYPRILNIEVVTMTEYSRDLEVKVAFPKIVVPETISEVLAAKSLKQYHVSETEKFPHVTYFFSNGREEPGTGEVWDKVSSNTLYEERYQNVPQMSAPELTQRLIEAIDKDFDFYLLNFANPDMVGHTGNLTASIAAVKAIDECLRRIYQVTEKHPELLIMITADHGNIEEVHEVHSGRIHKSHTTNPVPLLLIGRGLELPRPRKPGYLYLATQVPEGLLSDVAPTLLDIMHLPKPQQMTGISLLPTLIRQLRKPQ